MGTSSSVRAAPGWPVIGEGDFTLIDTHTHFYDPTRAEGVPWPPRDDKLLDRQVLPKDYRAVPVPRPVLATVVVETSPWLEDNQWVLDLAAHDPFIVRFAVNLPVGTKEFGGHPKRFPANPLFRGIRLLPDLYDHLNPMPCEAAVEMEMDLAEDLRRAGYTVTGGH